ncbi:MAG: FKBP-type peptidyl-prolyl cis-trans isomerase [Bacteroidales bacterium]|nr:FKBP-type peptidyl-prolyl cis-trans isomerase [Bacteroidales bacterium]MBR4340990.1 FKBP-type peptidyl-prolyl cis-trans isomerase [Bacteroidales bacterium]MBR4512731.1 FKBP-type peptidyl-prolyl cis-trans isomerase [Bacteroidales bacterium]
MAQKRQQENQERESNFNRMVGKSIMEQNLKDDPTVKQTASGLQYKVLVEGTGARPTEKDRVKVHYTGTFYNGQVFDSSVQRGEPASFYLNQVIKGWTEGLQLMTVGSKYKFWIPADLAYGNRPVGNAPKSAGSMLIFEVELLAIDNPK